MAPSRRRRASRRRTPRARRNLRVLVAAQVVLGSQLPVTFILGGLAGQMLAPNKCLATLPITLIITRRRCCRRRCSPT